MLQRISFGKFTLNFFKLLVCVINKIKGILLARYCTGTSNQEMFSLTARIMLSQETLDFQECFPKNQYMLKQMQGHLTICLQSKLTRLTMMKRQTFGRQVVSSMRWYLFIHLSPVQTTLLWQPRSSLGMSPASLIVTQRISGLLFHLCYRLMRLRDLQSKTLSFIQSSKCA